MSKDKQKKTARPRAILPRGFRDSLGSEVRRRQETLSAIRAVFDLHGFEPLDTPAIEYVEALGKFLPDVERPMGGVFGFQDDDGKWLALRYDLTAPLARMVAGSYDALPKPFRRYQTGPVYRNERPGPGRFREFTQCDADSVGTAEMAADAELCMMTAEALEAVGIARGDYLVRVNNRKVLNGVLEHIGIAEDDAGSDQRRAVLRAIDKLDRLGLEGVKALLGAGRKDRSGDFTKGAGLNVSQIDAVLAFVGAGSDDPVETCDRLAGLVGDSQTGAEGVAELREIAALAEAAGFGPDRLKIDPSVVRGLDYYTGPVFEAELTFPVVNDKGETVVFGAVAGGGRYDNLVKRFIGRDVPATGVSIGVDRLLSALEKRHPDAGNAADGPVVVVVMDRTELPRYQAMAEELRAVGIRAEMYVGGSGMRAQLKYADKRRAPIAVIEGEDERAQDALTLKDLKLGAELAASIESRDDWTKGQPAQMTVPRGELVAQVRAILARHGQGRAG